MRYFILCVLGLFINISYAIDIVPISNFDSNKYLGNWYEIARLPNRFEKNCIAPITANYSVNPDNNLQIIVVNKCNTKNNEPDVATGVAKFVEFATVGKLKVTFLPKWLRWLPVGYGDYWILNTDYDNISVVGSPDHEYLWILARTENTNQDQLNQAIEFAKEQGFDVSKLIFNYAATSHKYSVARGVKMDYFANR
ncbi:MAG: lipocalin family protein [Burkholderiales bacterium]|nr:lipocalin family protein [Burkholderiales bacterium]